MKRKRHTEEQIVAILKEHEAGMKTADLCRKHGISEASFYNWKAKYGGLEVSEAKRLRGLAGFNRYRRPPSRGIPGRLRRNAHQHPHSGNCGNAYRGRLAQFPLVRCGPGKAPKFWGAREPSAQPFSPLSAELFSSASARSGGGLALRAVV